VKPYYPSKKTLLEVIDNLNEESALYNELEMPSDAGMGALEIDETIKDLTADMSHKTAAALRAGD
jgi:hypothetical protein